MTDVSQTNLVAAAIFIAISLGAIWIASDDPPSSMRSVGSAKMPIGIDVLIVLCSTGIAVQTLLLRAQAALTRTALLGWCEWATRHVVRSTVRICSGLVAFCQPLCKASLFIVYRAATGTLVFGTFLLALPIPTMFVRILFYGRNAEAMTAKLAHSCADAPAMTPEKLITLIAEKLVPYGEIVNDIGQPISPRAVVPRRN